MTSNNQARSKQIHQEIRLAPRTLKTIAILAIAAGHAYNVQWLEAFGIIGLFIAWYWLDFNLWRWMNNR